MAVTVTINGVNYSYPTTGDESWGSDATNAFVALVSGTLQPNSTSFVLTGGDVDFGNTYGLKPQYVISKSANPADAGVLRLANTDLVEWRNTANTGNLVLGVDTSDNLTYNGVPVVIGTDITPATHGGTGQSSYAVGDTLYADSTTTLSKLSIGATSTTLVSTGSAPSWALLVDANIDAAAAISYSKLALTGSVVNADISASAAIDYSKLALTGSIVDADISASAAIEYSKLDLAGSVNLASDVTGTLPIANGGTGQASATAAFDALAPSTTKGDLIAFNGTNNVRQAVGTNGNVLTADSTAATGMAWKPPAAGTTIIFRASASPTAFASGVQTVVGFNNTDVNIGSAWNGADTFTAPETGVYLYNAYIAFQNFTASASLDIYLYVNGSLYQRARNTTIVGVNDTWGVQLSDYVSLTAGDTVQLQASQNSGGTVGAQIDLSLFGMSFQGA